MVVNFFSSYLVGWSTKYTWNGSMSDSRQADVRVGQGSALSPVLSALCIAPLMELFYLEAESLNLEATLLSYMDDGTLLVQSKSLEDNNKVLKWAY